MSGCQNLIRYEGRMESMIAKGQHERILGDNGNILYCLWWWLCESIHVLNELYTQKVNFTVCLCIIYFFLQNQDSLGKSLIPELGHRRYKMSLEHLLCY